MNELTAHQALRAEVTATAEDGLTVQTRQATNQPAEYPLRITRGGAWNLYVTWESDTGQYVDLSSGYTASCVVRYRSGETALVTLIQGDGITLSSGRGGITITRTAAQTAAYTWGPRAQYVLSVTNTGTGVTTVLLMGTVDVVN